MTLVIDLTPEIENRLEEEAARRGLAVPECARVLLEDALAPEQASTGSPPLTAEERAARVKALRGKFKHLHFTTEELTRNKQEEIELEEQRWERRLGKPSP